MIKHKEGVSSVRLRRDLPPLPFAPVIPSPLPHPRLKMRRLRKILAYAFEGLFHLRSVGIH